MTFSYENQQDLLAGLELAELDELIETLPNEFREKFRLVFDRAVKRIERRRHILHFVQEALTQLRLDMKYLMFDLNATKNERDIYKQKSEQ